MPGFDVFWQAYPKKKSRGDAEKAWKTHVPDDTCATLILRAVQRAAQSEDWRKDGGRYVPYPATWLRAKGWLDESASGAVPIWEQ